MHLLHNAISMDWILELLEFGAAAKKALGSKLGAQALAALARSLSGRTTFVLIIATNIVSLIVITNFKSLC